MIACPASRGAFSLFPAYEKSHHEKNVVDFFNFTAIFARLLSFLFSFLEKYSKNILTKSCKCGNIVLKTTLRGF